MADYLILRRSPDQIHAYLTDLKYPVRNTETQEFYVDEGHYYRPDESTLNHWPFVVLNTGGKGLYWWGAMKWGYKHKVNAESEPMIPDHNLGNLIYGASYKQRRCLVLVTGFVYNIKGKAMYYTHFKDNRIFALAAIYDKIADDKMNGFALANVAPNEILMRMGFNNMPSIITDPKKSYRWLRPTATHFELDECLRTYNDPQLETYSIGMIDEVPRRWVA